MPGVTHGCQAGYSSAPWVLRVTGPGCDCRVPAHPLHLVPRAERSQHVPLGPVTRICDGSTQWGHREGVVAFWVGGTHPPEQPLPPIPTRRSRRGVEGGFLGGMKAPLPVPPCSHHGALPCSDFEAIFPPKTQGCSEPELEPAQWLPETDWSVAQMEPTSPARRLLGCTGLVTDPGHITPCAPQKTAPLSGAPSASLPPSPPLPPLPCSWLPRCPGRVWGGSYLQGCRVSKGLQGLQGLQGLSSVGLWLLGDKLQGKTCRRGVSGCWGAPQWHGTPVAQPPPGGLGSQERGQRPRAAVTRAAGGGHGLELGGPGRVGRGDWGRAGGGVQGTAGTLRGGKTPGGLMLPEGVTGVGVRGCGCRRKGWDLRPGGGDTRG